MLTPKKLKMSLETNSENNKMSPKITKNTKSGNKILTEIIEKISVCFEEIRNLNREKISDKPFLFEKSSLIEKIKNISFSNTDNTTLINFFSEHVNEINVGNFVLSITKSFLNFGHFDQKNIQSLLKMLSKINLAVILRSGRQDLYTILSILLKSHFELNWDKNELITIYMTTMEEETDPSCLLKSFECFKLVIKTCKNSISEKTKKNLFSLIDRYFPINYQSENEDKNLKTNLIKAFRECLTCDPLFVSLSFDFFCEKLCSLQNLEECSESALILTIFLQKYSYFVTKKFLRIAFDSFLETFKDDLSNEELQILCLNGIKIVAKKFFGISIFKSKSEFDIEKEISDLFQVLKMNKDSSSPEVTILIQIAESCSEANNIIMKQGWDELKRIFYTKEVHFPRLEGFMQVFYGAIDSNFANLAKTKILADNEKDICELFRSGLIGASPDVRALSLATLFKLSQIFSETFPKSNFFENQNIVTMATSLMLKDEAVSVKRQAAKSLLEMTAYHFSKNENNIRKELSYVKPEIWPFLVEKITKQQNCDETTTKVIEEFLQNSSNLHWSIFDTIFDSFIKTCLDFRYKENQMFVSKIFAVFAGITKSFEFTISNKKLEKLHFVLMKFVDFFENGDVSKRKNFDLFDYFSVDFIKNFGLVLGISIEKGSKKEYLKNFKTTEKMLEQIRNEKIAKNQFFWISIFALPTLNFFKNYIWDKNVISNLEKTINQKFILKIWRKRHFLNELKSTTKRKMAFSSIFEIAILFAASTKFDQINSFFEIDSFDNFDDFYLFFDLLEMILFGLVWSLKKDAFCFLEAFINFAQTFHKIADKSVNGKAKLKEIGSLSKIRLKAKNGGLVNWELKKYHFQFYGKVVLKNMEKMEFAEEQLLVVSEYIKSVPELKIIDKKIISNFVHLFENDILQNRPFCAFEAFFELLKSGHIEKRTEDIVQICDEMMNCKIDDSLYNKRVEITLKGISCIKYFNSVTKAEIRPFFEKILISLKNLLDDPNRVVRHKAACALNQWIVRFE